MTPTSIITCSLDALPVTLENTIVSFGVTGLVEIYVYIPFDPKKIIEIWPAISIPERQSIVRDCVVIIVITYNSIKIFYRFQTMDSERLRGIQSVNDDD